MGFWAAALPFVGGLIDTRSNRKSTQQANQMSDTQFWANFDQNRNQFNKSLNFAKAQNQQARNQFNRQFKFNRKQAAKDRKMQRQFAKEGTGWAFDDLMQSADEAGIHRLAALGGASGNAYSPVGGMSLGGGTSGAAPNPTGGVGSTQVFEEDSAYLGSAIGEALRMYQDQRDYKFRERMGEKELKLMDAQINELNATSRSRIAAARAATTNITTDDQDQVTGGPPETFTTEGDEKGYVWTRTTAGNWVRVPKDPVDIWEQMGHALTEARGWAKKAVGRIKELSRKDQAEIIEAQRKGTRPKLSDRRAYEIYNELRHATSRVR